MKSRSAPESHESTWFSLDSYANAKAVAAGSAGSGRLDTGRSRVEFRAALEIFYATDNPLDRIDAFVEKWKP